MIIPSQCKSCSDLGRVLVVNDPPTSGALVMWRDYSCALQTWNLTDIRTGTGEWSQNVTAAGILAGGAGSALYDLAGGLLTTIIRSTLCSDEPRPRVTLYQHSPWYSGTGIIGPIACSDE